MTDKLSAMAGLVAMGKDHPAERDASLAKFYEDDDADALVLNKWFSTRVRHAPTPPPLAASSTQHPAHPATPPTEHTRRASSTSKA